MIRRIILLLPFALAMASPCSAGAVDFERQVVPLLGRMGCAAGSCHGSFQGRGGFRLSLFGHSPEQDYRALTRDGMARRVDRFRPERSLLLLKPTASTPHEGGKRFARDSWQYRVLRGWIAQGAAHEPGSGRVRRLELHPAESRLVGPGGEATVRATVEYADGSRADVTPYCEVRVQDDSVASVGADGKVRGIRPGDTAIVASYLGQIATARVLVPAPVEKGKAYPTITEANFIDREVFAKLRRLNIPPSELSDDATFLRRVTIDTIGSIPSPEEVRAFLANRSPDKRRHKVDELLCSPLHAALWATRFSDITGNNVGTAGGTPRTINQQAKMWHDWLRRRFAQNVPHDQLVRGILSATSKGNRSIDDWIREEAGFADDGHANRYADRSTLDLFWRRTSGDEFFPLEQMAELTAAAFLGVRMECAQCHKHPFDRWTQADYRSYANVFGQVKLGSSQALRSAMFRLLEERRESGKGEKPVPRLTEVFVSNTPLRRLSAPDTGGALPAKIPGGPEISLEGDARERLVDWLVRPGNPFFARNLVNRVWAHYFGAGLVEPVDGFSAGNPPTNPQLLDALADDFTRSGYDFRRLERLILTSRTYALSSSPRKDMPADPRNHSHARVRRLMAEAVVDVLDAALGSDTDFGKDALRGTRAIEIAQNQVADEHVGRIFRTFGRPSRTALCDCERPTQSTLPQTMFLMTDRTLLAKIERGRLKTLLSSKKTDTQIVDELFLATLSRFPDEAERRAALRHVGARGDRRAGFVDTVWALINTREFILNH
jgi:Protein of unknown function (DUF1553)/Protein of unknown function (DUF1549)